MGKEGGGGKAKKKKWSKGKSRDKLNNLVLFDKNTYDKLYKEVPSYKLITPSIVSERLKVRGSLAKRALEEMASKGVVKLVSAHRSQIIYTRVTKDNEDDAPEEESWWKSPRSNRRRERRKRRQRLRLLLLRPSKMSPFLPIFIFILRTFTPVIM